MARVSRVVVGAGLSGLLAATRAVQRGERVTVLEANDFPGGQISSVSVPTSLGAVRVDSGAESFSVAGPHALRLVADLGLGHLIEQPAQGSARIVTGYVPPFKIPNGFMGIPLNLEDPDLKEVFSEAEITLAKSLDSRPLPSIDVVSGYSVGHLVENRLGKAFLERLVRPVFEGVQGLSPESANATQVWPELVSALARTGGLVEAAAQIRGVSARAGAAVSGIRGGISTVITALHQQLIDSGVEFRFGTDGVQLEELGDQRLTVATPIDSAAALLVRLNPGLANVGFGLVSQPGAMVLTCVESLALNTSPLGTGALITEQGSEVVKATTHVNAKWRWVQEQLSGNQHILRLNIRNPEATVIDEQLIAALPSLISEIYECRDAEVLWARAFEWQTSHIPPEYSSEWKAQLKQTAADHHIELCGSYLSGNGILAIARDHYERLESNV